jgi:hypothetical protein
VCLLQLGFGEVGEVLEEDGADGLLPGEVDQLLVGLDGIRDGRRCRKKQREKRYRF